MDAAGRAGARGRPGSRSATAATRAADVAERVLSTRELNRALLARQLLLERSRAPLVKALEQVAGIQMQYAPSAYIALATRLERFALAELTRVLERRKAVQATLMRATIHLVSARDYRLFADGVRADLREIGRASCRQRA